MKRHSKIELKRLWKFQRNWSQRFASSSRNARRGRAEPAAPDDGQERAASERQAVEANMTTPVKVASAVVAPYLVPAAIAFVVHRWSAATSVGNSGESGLLLLPFSLPWILWFPALFDRLLSWTGSPYGAWWLIVAVNAVLLAGVGLGLGRLLRSAYSTGGAR